MRTHVRADGKRGRVGVHLLSVASCVSVVVLSTASWMQRHRVRTNRGSTLFGSGGGGARTRHAEGDLYVYVLNNPIGLRDLDGRQEKSFATRLRGWRPGARWRPPDGRGCSRPRPRRGPARRASRRRRRYRPRVFGLGVDWHQVFCRRNERSGVEQIATGAASVVTTDKGKSEVFGTAVDITLGIVNSAGPVSGGPRLAVALTTTLNLLPTVAETARRCAWSPRVGSVSLDSPVEAS